MKSAHWNVSRLAWGLVAALVIIVTLVSANMAQAQASEKQGTVEHIKVHGAALEVIL